MCWAEGEVDEGQIKNINFDFKTIPHPSLRDTFPQGKANPSVTAWQLPFHGSLPKSCYFPFRGRQKTVQNWFYSIKFKKTNLNNITYNFIPKNAMKLRFDKSFCPVFLKTGGVLGQSPKVLYLIVFQKEMSGRRYFVCPIELYVAALKFLNRTDVCYGRVLFKCIKLCTARCLCCTDRYKRSVE